MTTPSLLNQLRRTFNGRKHSRRHQQRLANATTAAAVEVIEERKLLSATNDLAGLSDEFDTDTTADWLRIHEEENWNAEQLDVYDINQTQPGRLVMAPGSVVWYQDWRGPLAFKDVTGDFVFTTQINISDRDDIGGSDADNIPNDAQFSLAGAMIRTPRNISDPLVDWQPGSRQDDGTNNGENYVFFSLGHATNGQFTFEVKSTRNSNSQLELTAVDTDVVNIQIARLGNTILTLRQIPGQEWVVHERFHRPDMPETLQVGMVSYSDWSKANDYDEFFHNRNSLQQSGVDPTPEEAFNPDLVAGFEYARYVRPMVPAELEGVDLLNAATDEQLLSFLGEHANLVGDVEPPSDLPTVSITAIDESVDEISGTAAAFMVSRTGASTDAPLTVNYAVSGSATPGTDYAALSESVVIPAGSASVNIDVDVLEDVVVEGSETIELQLIDAVFYELGDPTADVVISDDDFAVIGNQTIPGGLDQLVVTLASTHPDGTALTYGASVIGSDEYTLDQQYDFYTQASFHENWGGLNERWIRGDGSAWFYLLPTGSLNRWGGSFASSQEIAELSSDVYDDPTRLVDVASNATVNVVGNLMTIDPQDGFVGNFDVDVTTSNGQSESIQRITVTVEAINNAVPQITTVADQTMSTAAPELRIPFVATDADGDPLQFAAELVQSEAWLLDQKFNFTSNGDYYENWGGHNERWVNASNGNTSWYYLLPDGQLFRWGGSFEGSTHVADLSSSVYDDPSQLTDPVAVAAEVSVDGNEIVVAPEADFVGHFAIQLSASDGLATATTQFTVNVINTAPEFPSIGDLAITNSDGTLLIDLSATDSDGDALIYSAEIINSEVWQLDTSLDLQASDNFYENWGGQNEKWLRSSTSGWHYILPNGEFRRYNGSFENSQLIASLDSSYYGDPNLIADPQALPVTVSITGSQLFIDAADDFVGSFQIRLQVTDGFEEVRQLITVSMGL